MADGATIAAPLNQLISPVKGQLISEQNCGVLNFLEMQRNITRISALATKMGPIKKDKGTLSCKLVILMVYKYTI